MNATRPSAMPTNATPPPQTPTAQQRLIARNWRAHKPKAGSEKNSLKAHTTVETAAGFVFEIGLFEDNGKRWVSMPANPWQNEHGKTVYKPQIQFRDAEARERFRRLALDAVDKLLAEGQDL